METAMPRQCKLKQQKTEDCLLLLRSPDVFSALKFRKRTWVPVKLRITAFAIERLDASTGEICQIVQLYAMYLCKVVVPNYAA